VSDDRFINTMAFVLAVLAAVGGLATACYGPCEWWRGGSLADVPARCIPELAK